MPKNFGRALLTGKIGTFYYHGFSGLMEVNTSGSISKAVQLENDEVNGKEHMNLSGWV